MRLSIRAPMVLAMDSDALMAKSARLLGAVKGAVSLPVKGGGIIASSLPRELRDEVQTQLAPHGVSVAIDEFVRDGKMADHWSMVLR